MSDKDLIRLDKQLCFMLYASSRAMTKAYQPLLKKLSITYPQYIVLMVLWEWADTQPEEPSVKALGERLRLDSGTLTPLLKRLELLALVTRQRDSDDERRVYIYATAKAKRMQATAKAWLQAEYSAMGMSAGDIKQLREDLKKLLAVLPS